MKVEDVKLWILGHRRIWHAIESGANLAFPSTFCGTLVCRLIYPEASYRGRVSTEMPKRICRKCRERLNQMPGGRGMSETECEACGGDREVMCPDCEGVGYHLFRLIGGKRDYLSVDYLHPFSAGQHRETCPRCDGTGKVSCEECSDEKEGGE